MSTYKSDTTKKTECERIIAQGIISEDFLREEQKCGYIISSEMKKVWAVELDLLLEFDRVCRKYGLKYYLFYGSLLGAIRHGGFIPWDEDIDVVMPRKDYDRIMGLADEFMDPYFLQTPYSDPGYYYSYIKLRNSNTTGITTQFSFQNINWGLMLDIYPVDYVADVADDSWYKKISMLARDNSNYMRSSNPSPSMEEKQRISDYSGRDPLRNFEDIQQIASQYASCPTKHLSVAVLTLHDLRNNYFEAEWFKESETISFEGIECTIPKGYDEILKVLYGEYLRLPDIEDRGIWHSNVIYDADMSYKEYIRVNYD